VFSGYDPGFCGPFYTAADTLQDAQEAINFFLERDPGENAKEPIAMLGCPGLNAVANLGNTGAPVRGCWVLPGGSQALAAAGNMLYLVKLAPVSTFSTGYNAVAVGTLLTSSGPVCIRDNGVLSNGLGGYAVIVDGKYAYYYLLSGSTYTTTFTGGLILGSSTITLPGTLPNGLIVSSGGTLSAPLDNLLPAGTNIISVDTIGLTISMSNNSLGTNASDSISLTIPIFGQITDQGFLGAQRIAFIEGWLIFNYPGTRTFFTTGPTPYQLLFPGAFFSLKDSSTDNLVTLEENNRELWLIGERTSEVWYNAGNPNFAFSRIPGVGPQIGCAAVNSIARLGNQLVWLGDNEQGENIVVIQDQYAWDRISNHAVENAISSYAVISDAIGYTYEEEGHLFYMLTFPSADVTWCFDASTKQWHKRLSWNATTGTFHRHRSNCFMNFGNARIVGDYQSGQLMQMSRAFYTDAGNVLRALRRTPHQWQKANRGRLFFSQLQIEFTPGVGLQQGQGSDPQVMLRYSDDGGFTWSNEIWVSIGKAGQTRNRAIWYMLGGEEVRDRIWEFSITDPVPRDGIGASCFIEAAAA
jgi:hypothetical protein